MAPGLNPLVDEPEEPAVEEYALAHVIRQNIINVLIQELITRCSNHHQK